MRSHVRATTALCAAAMLALGACTVGAPPGFSSGDQWTIPLIGPLEDGLLLVPALVNDKGPYVFAIDPDAHVSVIDAQVVNEAKTRTGEGPKMLDETDTQQTRLYGEVLRWQIGSLTVEGTRPAQVVPAGTFDTHGRRVHGLIGRDIIADSLVFSFDRDMGVITLSTQGHFKAPAGATALKYSKLHSQIQNAEVQPMARRLVKATIGGATVKVHLDLGALTSQLRSRSWGKAKLEASDVEIGVVDEAGTTRILKQVGVAPSVSVGTASAQNVAFVPYTDKRWPDQDIEGTLGLGFFKPFKVTVNWDKTVYYVSPRTNTRLSWQARLGRWQSKTIASCEHVGCVKVSVVDPLADKPAEERPEKHPGLVVSVVRDASATDMELEVLIAVTPREADKPLHHWLVANLPAGVPRVMTHLSADHLGADFTVVDVSPFPRKCPADGGCIDRIAAPQRLELTAVAGGGAPRVVLPTVLEGFRIAGDRGITPPDDTKTEISLSGKNRVEGKYHVCLAATGEIDSVDVLTSSGYAAYDRHIVNTIKGTWRYQPNVIAGKPGPVCTDVTFIYSQR